MLSYISGDKMKLPHGWGLEKMPGNMGSVPSSVTRLEVKGSYLPDTAPHLLLYPTWSLPTFLQERCSWQGQNDLLAMRTSEHLPEEEGQQLHTHLSTCLQNMLSLASTQTTTPRIPPAHAVPSGVPVPRADHPLVSTCVLPSGDTAWTNSTKFHFMCCGFSSWYF